MQQPCSNPSKSPEMLGKAVTQKYGNLQAFCTLQQSLANYLIDFTRQRSLVRAQHRPLESGQLVSYRHSAKMLVAESQALAIDSCTWARSSVGRAPPSHGGGHEFESRRVHSLNPLR